MNYLVIFKAYCEFTGANDASKPFNFLQYALQKNKTILAKDQCDYIIAKSIVINYGASFINMNILTFSA